MALFSHGYGHAVVGGVGSNPGHGTTVEGVFHPTRHQGFLHRICQIVLHYTIQDKIA